MPLSKNLAKQATWWILKLWHGKNVVPLRVRAGPAKGVVLSLDVRSESAYWFGRYDAYAFVRLPFSRYLSGGAVAWDCGAFVGYYAAVFRKIVGANGRVVVFEASTENHVHLAPLPALNGWRNVEVRHEAVGRAHAVIEFAANRGAASGPYFHGSYFDDGKPLVVEKIPSRGVDELVFELGLPAPAFIKFDLEGAEEFALHNGPRVFAEARPVLLLELHGEAARDAAGRFLETYRYGATCVDQLADLAQGSTAQWLDSLRAHAVRNLRELRALSFIPHMLLAIPAEHPDWTAHH